MSDSSTDAAGAQRYAEIHTLAALYQMTLSRIEAVLAYRRPEWGWTDTRILTRVEDIVRQHRLEVELLEARPGDNGDRQS
jgi:hypothetical protein